MARRCEVYRHFDANGALLYVGMGWSTLARLMRGHRKQSHWFDQIARIEIERFPTREAAYKAEWDAIVKEKPRHNLATPGKTGSLLVSAEARAEKALWVERGKIAGIRVRANSALAPIVRSVLAAEVGDLERAKMSAAYLGLTQPEPIIPDVEQIKSSLKLSTGELVKILGVSRQAIHNWKAGGPVKAENMAKLLNLKATAEAKLFG